MEIKKDVTLQEVAYSNDTQKATMTFLDWDAGEVLEVNFNKQSYDNGKWVADPDKAAKVDEWCETYFNLPFKDLSKAIGTKHTIYSYPDRGFNSLWEAAVVDKFDKSMNGKVITSKIDSIEDDGKIAIKVNYSHNGKHYCTKYTYAKYVEERKQWFLDPVKQRKQYERFEELFGVSIENADKIVGKEIMVEVKMAFGKFPYGDIKKPEWA